MPYPDHFSASEFGRIWDKPDDDGGKEADLATLATLTKRVKALQDFLAAWEPCTYRADDAHGHFVDMLDELAGKIGVTIDEITYGEDE